MVRRRLDEVLVARERRRLGEERLLLVARQVPRNGGNEVDSLDAAAAEARELDAAREEAFPLERGSQRRRLGGAHEQIEVAAGGRRRAEDEHAAWCGGVGQVGGCHRWGRIRP